MTRQMRGGEAAGRPVQPSDTRRASKADQVYENIKEAILSGGLEPGVAIDKIALSERLGMSRFPITTAINRLAYERLVVIEPQHGSFVAKISAEDVRELMLIRRSLEAEIAGDAALRLGAEALAELERSLRYQEAAAAARDYAGFYALDVEFHRLIIVGAQLRHAKEILEGIRTHLERIRRLLLTPPGRLPNTLAEHRSVADALRARNPAAAREAMRTHLIETTVLFETIARERPNLFSA
ncbi:MAG: GntR family transcriptional regulator [Methylobacteriaceae bacterium]|nr:GntR family transcriptional regulator [Methylobacteriaceae bacterium]